MTPVDLVSILCVLVIIGYVAWRLWVAGDFDVCVCSHRYLWHRTDGYCTQCQCYSELAKAGEEE